MQTINLTQNNFKMPPVVYMVQNDTGRDLKMILDDVTLAGTETGAVAIRRSDGSYYTITATLVAADNAFTIEADQALTQPGKTECQLKVTDSNNDVISSYTFIIMVQPSTDGISEEQLGYSVQDLMNAAATIEAFAIDFGIADALLQIASKVAYVDEHGQDYYDALYNALYSPYYSVTNVLTGCTSSNESAFLVKNTSYSATISPSAGYTMENASVSILMGGIDVTSQVYDDGVISIPSVNGNLTITIVATQVAVSSIDAVFTPGDAVFCTADSVSDTNQYLTVTANWTDGTSEELSSADYELSGDFSTSGTQTVTVTYSGKTDTFTVYVRAATLLFPSSLYQLSTGNHGSGSISGDVITFTSNASTSDYQTFVDTAGSTSSFQKLSALVNHRIRTYRNVEFSGNSISVSTSFYVYTNTNNKSSRNKYTSGLTTPSSGGNGLKKRDIVLPNSISSWDGSGSTSTDQYFRERIYLIASESGSTVTFTDKVYDLGVDP